MKRVDDEILGVLQAWSRRAPQQEMTWEVDAGHVETGAASHLDVNHRQRDGNAKPAVQNLIQEAVTRICVLLDVAGETQLAEQVLVQYLDAGVPIRIDPRRRIVGQDLHRQYAPAGFPADRVELAEVRPDVERGLFDARDEQGGHREVGVRAERDVCESVNEVLAKHRL